jgi:hypothetical protein
MNLLAWEVESVLQQVYHERFVPAQAPLSLFVTAPELLQTFKNQTYHEIIRKNCKVYF